MIRVLAFVLVVAACGGGDGTTESSVDSLSTTTTPIGIDAGEVMISIESNGGAAGGGLEVRVTLTNGTDLPVTLVRPLFIPNLVKFTVRDVNGDPMPFYGPHKLLKALGEDGFVTVEPGQSTSEVLDLGPGFQLDSGTYSVVAEYRNPAAGSHEGGRALIFEHGQGPVSPSIEIVVAP